MKTQDYKCFHLEIDARGVLTVAIDVPEKRLNVLTPLAMQELTAIVSDIETQDHLRLVVFRSQKDSGFLAGADVSVIAAIGNASQAGELILAGQTLFRRIEELTIPTIALVHGPCLGGGLEWALSCDYRVAIDSPNTKLGLPEIKLGLIPGWGGTQRLPRCVPLSQALEMILRGKTVSAQQAALTGLADRVLSPEQWQQEFHHFTKRVLSNAVVTKTPITTCWKRSFQSSPLVWPLIMRLARKQVRSQVRHYPALRSAIKAIEAGLQHHGRGFVVERDQFVELLSTPTCRNCLNLFFDREAARHPSTWSTDSSTPDLEPFRHIGVVGAGVMGAGIGQFTATRSFSVSFREINQTALQSGQRRVQELIKRYAQRMNLSERDTSTLRDRVSFTTELADLHDVDLVIEAAVEREDVKRTLFAELESIVSPNCILATNTSSLSVSNLAKATRSPHRVAGLHFFNPVHRMELVEVVRGCQTDDHTVARLIGFVRSLGKTPIVTSDSPGFLVNRVLFPYLGEAVLMVHEGHHPSTIDAELRRFGMPMGPLELLDQVGLDVAMHVAESLGSVLPDLHPVLEHLQAMTVQGRLGKKSGNGFYSYRKGKPIKESVADSSTNRSPTADWFLDDGLTEVQRRLIYPMLTESIRCRKERVVTDNWMVDLAMVLGTGFAPHRGGPLRLIDAISAQRVDLNLRQLELIHGSRFAAPRLLQDMAREHALFYPPKGVVCPSETTDVQQAEPTSHTAS